MTGSSAAATTSAVMTETVAGRRESRIAIFSQVRTKDRCAATTRSTAAKTALPLLGSVEISRPESALRTEV
jgi:hypothetical protein